MKLLNYLTACACLLTAKAANMAGLNQQIYGCFDLVQGPITVDTLNSIRPHSCIVYGTTYKVPAEIINYVLGNDLADVNACDRYGMNSITYALIRGDYEAADALVAQGADINDCCGSTPMMKIMRWERLSDEHAIKAINYLLRHDADPNKIGIRGFSPLAAAATRNAELVKMFLNFGLDPNYISQDSLKMTALHAALSRNPLYKWTTLEVVKVLLEHGADLKIKDVHGNNPLITAILTQHYDEFYHFLKVLNEKGSLSLLNEANSMGVTAIGLYQLRRDFGREQQIVTEIINRFIE